MAIMSPQKRKTLIYVMLTRVAQTLVLRAAPQPAGAPKTFSPGCIEAARATLHRHQDCLAIIERSSEDLLSKYVRW